MPNGNENAHELFETITRNRSFPVSKSYALNSSKIESVNEKLTYDNN